MENDTLTCRRCEAFGYSFLCCGYDIMHMHLSLNQNTQVFLKAHNRGLAFTTRFLVKSLCTPGS